MPVELLEDNNNVYMVYESMTVNEINGTGQHEWNVNSKLVNQFGKIKDNCIDIKDSINVIMYDITKKESMNILINKSKSLNIKYNNDNNVTQNEGIIIDDFDINDIKIKIKEIVNDNIQKAQEKYVNDLKKKQNKSIKTYSFEIGITVLKKNSRDSERKVGKLNATWLVNYIITDLRGNYERIKNSDDGKTTQYLINLSN